MEVCSSGNRKWDRWTKTKAPAVYSANGFFLFKKRKALLLGRSLGRYSVVYEEKKTCCEFSGERGTAAAFSRKKDKTGGVKKGGVLPQSGTFVRGKQHAQPEHLGGAGPGNRWGKIRNRAWPVPTGFSPRRPGARQQNQTGPAGRLGRGIGGDVVGPVLGGR